MTNGYLETELEWMAGMKNMRLKDLPSFIRTTDINDTMLNYDLLNGANVHRAKGVILNTFDELEHDVLEAMKSKFSLRLFAIGPLNLICHQNMDGLSNSIGANLWKEETECLDWLDQRDPESVIYVNFGSVTVMAPEQLIEFAWGLANSGHHFFWVVRPDLVKGSSAISSDEFKTAVGGRGLLATWCPQEQVLAHRAVGCFLTHSGWNSTVESISSGVPMVCWPFFSEQPTNCRFSCTSWGVGLELERSAGRGKVEGVVREVMGGEEGKTLRKKAIEWKVKAESAVKDGGSSHTNLERLLSELFACKTIDQIK